MMMSKVMMCEGCVHRVALPQPLLAWRSEGCGHASRGAGRVNAPPLGPPLSYARPM